MGIGNNRGFALPLVLLVILVLSLLGTALWQYSVTDTIHVSRDEKSMQAYYLARSGAEATADYIINNPDGIDMPAFVNDLNATTASNATTLGSGTTGNFKVKVERNADNSIINIISTGYVGDISKTVSLQLSEAKENGGSLLFDMAVFSNEGMSLDGSSSIIGTAGTNTITNGSVQLDGNPRISDLWIGPGAIIGDVVDMPSWGSINTFIPGGVSNLDTTRTYILPDFPDFPDDNLYTPEGRPITNKNLTVGDWPDQNYTLDLSDSSYENNTCYFSNVTVKSNYTLTINVGTGTRSLRVGTLNMPQGNIVLQGSGNLILYVDDDFILTNGSKVNNGGNPDKIMMYYDGTDTVKLTGDTRFVGSIYAKTANIDLAAGGNLTGNIITGGDSVIMRGGSSATVRAIYAPNADVELHNGASLTGSIICNQLEMYGGAKVTYDTSVNGDFPLPIEIPGGSEITNYQKIMWY